jgi:Tfp pilus assembly protein PilF
MSAARVEEARSCLEQATKSDPEYPDAWALLGMSYLDGVRLRMMPRSQDKELLDRALWAAQVAADIAPDSALAQRSLLLVHSFRGEVEQALAAGERAITLSPNNAEILAEFGMRLAMMGQWERGVSLIDEAIARNPAHPGWYHTAPAINFYRQGRYAEALEEARQIDAPGWVHNHTILAMIYGQLGQEEEARAAVGRVLDTEARVLVRPFDVRDGVQAVRDACDALILEHLEHAVEILVNGPALIEGRAFRVGHDAANRHARERAGDAAHFPIDVFLQRGEIAFRLAARHHSTRAVIHRAGGTVGALERIKNRGALQH